MICPFCQTEIPDQARKCRQCRAWLLKPGETVPESSPDKPPVGGSSEMPSPAAPPPPPPPVQYIPVPVPQYVPPPPAPPAAPPAPPEPSAGFAVVTLLLWFCMWPLAAVLTIVGMFTGPRRGCFVAMFFLIMVPITTYVILALNGFESGIEPLDEFFWKLRSESTPRPQRIERTIQRGSPWDK